MKTLTKLFTAVCLLGLASCAVYTTPVATQPPPPPTVVYTQAAPAPAPVYSGGVNGAQQQPAPAPAPVYTSGVNGAQQQPAPVYTAGVNGAQQQPAPQVINNQQPVTMQTFYDELSPYGQWVNYGSYGYVWIPAAGTDFTPYSTAGHWAYTDYGWMWVSDYRWGWATFHYGRWDFDAVYGWMWIPDTQWGPAWVQWRTTPNGYYGWAPLQPNYGWNNYNSYNPPAERWTFCQRQYITNNNVSNYYEPRQNYNGYISQSTVITSSHYDNESHVTYASGPGQAEVSQATGTTITPVRVSPATAPGSTSVNNNGELMMYRPAVTAAAPATNGNTAVKPAPRTVTTLTQVQPVAQRTTTIKAEPMRVAPTNTSNSPQKVEAVQQKSEPVQQQKMQPVQQQQPVEQKVQPVQQQQPVEQKVQPVQQQKMEQPVQQKTQPVQQQPAQQKQQKQSVQQIKPQKQQQQKKAPAPKKEEGK